VASTGRIIDQFRDRLVLPLRNGDQIHGFIGRRNPTPADGDTTGPKYLNTPHTDLFDKGAQLFGLSEGRAALEAGATPVLVEGFFDAIAVTLAGAGLYVGVAPLGTSLTADQANQLRSYIGAERRGVTVATDGDLAGQIGARRAFWMLTARGDWPRLVAMSDAQDPASVLQHAGPAVLRAALIDAQPLARLLLHERLTHVGEELQVLSDCAVVIAAQPPHTWMEQIEYLAARTEHGPGVVQQAVADEAARWTLDPLGCAQEQIGDLAAVRARLQRGAHAPVSADRESDLELAADVAANRRLLSGQSEEPNSPHEARAAAGTTTTQPWPMDAWRQLAHSIHWRLATGQEWPVLWRAIQEADAAGCDVARELGQLAAERQLLGEHPGTELAYRLRAATQTFSHIEPTLGPEQKQVAVGSGACAQPDTDTSRRPTSPRVR
jgi:DNA primase